MDDGAARFGEFFHAHYIEVLRFTERRVSDPQDAAELTADAFRIAWQRFDTRRRSDRAWVIGIARNLVLAHYRAAGRRTDATRRYQEEVAARAREADGSGTDNPLLDALAQLPEHAQELLRLRYWEGLPVSEIAQVVGVTAANARVRLHRARSRLQELLTTTACGEGR